MEEMIRGASLANFALDTNNADDWGDQLLGHDVL